MPGSDVREIAIYPERPCNHMGFTLAFHEFPYPYFGAYACTVMIVGPCGLGLNNYPFGRFSYFNANPPPRHLRLPSLARPGRECFELLTSKVSGKDPAGL